MSDDTMSFYLHHRSAVSMLDHPEGYYFNNTIKKDGLFPWTEFEGWFQWTEALLRFTASVVQKYVHCHPKARQQKRCKHNMCLKVVSLLMSALWWRTDIFHGSVNFYRTLTGRSESSDSAATAVSLVVSRCENVRKPQPLCLLCERWKPQRVHVSC